MVGFFKKIRCWLIGIPAFLGLWSVSSGADVRTHESRAILPGSPPTEHQQRFALLPAGVRVFEVPEQYPITDFRWVRRGDFELGYTDRIFIRGLILSTRHYDASADDDLADIAPVDIVIGWQRMSDPAVVSKIHILQRDRFYYWRVEDFPIPRDEIELTSTNLHVIANSPKEAARLLALKPGDLVSLEGYLTDVKKPDGFIWNTSRVRDDHGDGACEILMVNGISLIQSMQINDVSDPFKINR